MQMTGGAALEGIRVLDLSGNVTAGYCGKLFADLGADVFLVEPPSGFRTRYLPPFAPGVANPEASGMHAYLSANKRSVVCDGRDELLTMARNVTVVIDGNVGADRPIPLETLSELSPHPVLLSITWFGQDGPYRDFEGSDGVCQALTSQMDWLGEPGKPPLIPGGYQAQMVAGVTAFVAAMGQILAREMGNAEGPVHLDVSVYESNLCFTEIEAVRGHAGDPTRSRIGVNRFASTYPLGIYPCADGWLGVTVLTPSQWKSFCVLLGLENLLEIDRYWTSAERLRDADILDPIIASSVRCRSATELARKGQEARIPLSIVPTMEELTSVDQYVARGAFADVRHPDLGALPLPAAPFRLFGSPAMSGGSVSRLGEDTDASLAASRRGG